MPPRTIAFDHVAVAVPEPAALTTLMVGELGGEPYEAGPGFGFNWWQWRFRGGGVLEVLQPDGPPDGFLHRFMAAHGSGVHHVTFKVPDHDAAIAAARDLGFDVVGIEQSSPTWKEAFLHPKQAQGIVVQLVEAASSGGGANDWSRPFPPAPEPCPEPSALVGLRLNAHDEAQATRQWTMLLGADCESHGAALHFRWPGSPMRLHVTFDASRPAGPLGLEIDAPAAFAIPEGPHPLLGTPLLRAGSG